MTSPEPAKSPDNHKESPGSSGAHSISDKPLDIRIQQELERVNNDTGEGIKNEDLVRSVASVVLSIVHQERFSGPIPHPKYLKGYEDILPGTANRIIAMAEREQVHRHRWEDRSLSLEFVYSIAGLGLGFVIAVSLLVLSYLSSRNGYQEIALGFLGTGAIGMVASFIKGKNWLESRRATKTGGHHQLTLSDQAENGS